MEYIPCYGDPAEHWGLLPATRLASREILIEQNIKKLTGPSLCVLWFILYINMFIREYSTLVGNNPYYKMLRFKVCI